MVMKCFEVDFSELAKEQSFRFDVDFIAFQSNFLVSDYYSFNTLFDFSVNDSVDIEALTEDFYYSEIGNISKEGYVEPIKLNFDQRKIEEESYYKKIEGNDIIRVNQGDILLSKVRPNLKKYVLIDEENKNYFYTSALIHLAPKILGKILYYSFRTIFYENLIAISRQGKGYPTLKEDDLLYLKFDKNTIDLFLKTQDQIVAKIEPIERKIKDLKNQIKQPQEVINKVFAREFGFNLEGFERSQLIKDYFVDLSDFANNKDIRQSVKFHRPVGKFVLEELNKITNKIIKDFILEPIVLGSGISPKDFDEAGDCGYVGMSNIKNWCLDKESVMSVSKKFEAENKKKTIAKNDILIARSGEGTIGKCALIEDDEPNAIFADFTMRVRLKNYNQRFAYYFFRTTYFQVLIEINKKGLGNNTNIFPSQIREFPIIDISLTRQQKIVDEIKLELDLQEQIKKHIEAERQKIDVIIEQSISS